MAPPQNLADIIAGLNVKYDPQRQIAQQQIGTTQETAQAQQAALDAQKTQGFQGIQNQANSRGMLFSGFTPYEQAQFLSTKYLPAVANLNATTTDTVNGLNGRIATLTGQQQDEAQKTQSDQGKAYADWQNQQQQLAQQLAIAQMNNQTKLQVAGASGASGGVTPYQQQQLLQKQLSQYKINTRSDGSKGYVGPNGQTLSAYDYAKQMQGLGQNISFLDILAQDKTKYAQNAYAYANELVNAGRDEAYITKALKSNFGKLF